MTDHSMNRFEQEHLKRWWETTRHYLFADMKSLLGTAAAAEDRWSPPQTDSRGGRKRFIARVRGRLLRSVKSERKDDPLRELESVFQQQIAFIARHPGVPRRLLSWLAQDDDRGLQRRVRMPDVEIRFDAIQAGDRITQLAQVGGQGGRPAIAGQDEVGGGVVAGRDGRLAKLGQAQTTLLHMTLGDG